MNIINFKNVLALSPHPDDVELGCGATLAKLLDHKSKITLISFSDCTLSNKEFGVKKMLSFQEKACKHLGDIKIINLDFPVRVFDKHRQEILEYLYKLNKEKIFDLVFCPNSHDIHQDHMVITQEAFRAFKKTSILGYQHPWNNTNIGTKVEIHLELKYFNKKIKALKEYKNLKKKTMIF